MRKIQEAQSWRLIPNPFEMLLSAEPLPAFGLPPLVGEGLGDPRGAWPQWFWVWLPSL